MNALEDNPDEPVVAQRASAVGYTNYMNGKINFLNNEGERNSGYGREAAARMNIVEVVDSEFAEHHLGQILRDANAGVGTVYEIDIMARDGRRIALEVSTRIVRRDGGQVEVHWIAVPSMICNHSSFSTE